MGNPQHLEWLLEGVEAWNLRRKKTPFIPNLSDFGLHGTNLSGANLRNSNFRNSNLTMCNLSGANLEGSDFRNANLERANLWRAILKKCDLYLASLQDADLNGADLTSAHLQFTGLERTGLWETNFENAEIIGSRFHKANLRGANFKSCHCAGVIFFGADFKDAIFEDAFLGTLADATLVEDEGDEAVKWFQTNFEDAVNFEQAQLDSANGDRGTIIPHGFSYPDHWEADPIKKVEKRKFCFFSYAHQDRDTLLPIHKAIGRNHPIWWDQDIAGGAEWRTEIQDRLAACTCVITFWSKDSITSKSVTEEASTAQKSNKLIHVLLDDVAPPFGFSETQYIDLRNWNGDTSAPQFQKLLQAIDDKFNPPTKEALAERLSKSSPIDFPDRDGKLSVAETPIGSLPPAPNPQDVAERIAQIGNLCSPSKSRIDDGEYNAPRDLSFALSDMHDATELDPSRWYALADAYANLKLLSDQAGEEQWNTLLANQLKQIGSHLSHIRPALEPAQIEPGKTGAKPPETDPHITQADVEDVAKIGDQLADATEGEEAAQVFDEEAKDALHRFADALKDAAAAQDFGETEKRVKFARLRRVVRNAAMGLGAATAALGTGIATNVLTAKDAAQILATRLQEILDLLLKLF